MFPSINQQVARHLTKPTFRQTKRQSIAGCPGHQLTTMLNLPVNVNQANQANQLGGTDRAYQPTLRLRIITYKNIVQSD